MVLVTAPVRRLVAPVRKLVATVAVLAMVLVGVDVGARLLAQHVLASRARAAADARSATASVTGFPFLTHLLLHGTVQGLEVHLTDVPAGSLRLHEVDVSLQGTVVDRGALLSARTVRLKHIAAASATVTVTAAELSSAVGRTVLLPGKGVAEVDVGGRLVPATVEILGGHRLEVRAGGTSVLSTDLTSDPFVPSCDMALRIAADHVTVSCHVAPVPVRLVHAIAGT